MKKMLVVGLLLIAGMAFSSAAARPGPSYY